MFGGKDMTKMMKQMGMDMEEINAEKVEVKMGDKKIVFSNPQLSKIKAQGQEIFQLQGDYKEVEEINEEDVELVAEKADVSKDEARKALKNSEDVASAVLDLQ